ncbi:acyl-CoA reductase [Niabella drilacis]|uniref:Acyl-CoA reductase (LuxC) n=1 Tax=Niabella drilacis (strain DSM 25811 / CCM 8410 / CCUG 62505 / LMG 26954 / E90) TaxID=1285928 RepID=A0A1G6KUW3_NIADE|nr:acyl-CoA reductase [Niabella drilacis]SDC34879.1 Acyl-CoA reductase (LuxC) [Niabella drilacis]
MTLSQRIRLLAKLGAYMQGNSHGWLAAKEQAFRNNGWFLPDFINRSVQNIASAFLQEPLLKKWTDAYPNLEAADREPRLVGLVMAGNIPLVGFHDLLCVFISGHNCLVKASSKDETLIRHLVDQMISWEPEVAECIRFSDLLKGCDAYIATGSDNTAGYFDYYFAKYPHLIRRNRTSAALLTGTETADELSALADDVCLYFGMGCRNVTKVYVPEQYNFEPLLQALKKYDYLADVHKYRNNYDYNLALYLLNSRFYMSTPAVLLVEDPALFSPVSQLNYGFYGNRSGLVEALAGNPSVQCIVGHGCIPFGNAQSPAIDQYADGEDTLAFLLSLNRSFFE